MIRLDLGIKQPITEKDVIVTSVAGLTGKFTKIGNLISDWCSNKGIDAGLITKWYEYDEKAGEFFDYSVWRIEDAEDRTMFKLLWENRIVDEH